MYNNSWPRLERRRQPAPEPGARPAQARPPASADPANDSSSAGSAERRATSASTRSRRKSSAGSSSRSSTSSKDRKLRERDGGQGIGDGSDAGNGENSSTDATARADRTAARAGFQNVSGSDTGDPHLAFNGTTKNGSTINDPTYDNMSSALSRTC